METDGRALYGDRWVCLTWRQVGVTYVEIGGRVLHGDRLVYLTGRYVGVSYR